MKDLFEGVKFEHVKADALSLHALAGSCKECITIHSKQFLETFHVDIKQFMSGLHFLIGFDIVAFDQQVIQAPDGKSMSDVIIEQHGQAANDLINEILKYPKI